MKRQAQLVTALAVVLGAAGCRYDPVPAAIIDGLGPEKGTPSASHRPGEPCLACHDKYGGATPEMAVGGTIYTLDATGKHVLPAKNIRLSILDSSMGVPKLACTNAAGNFYIEAANWTDIVFPLTPTAGGVPMVSLVGRDGSCASCHKLPDMNSLNPVTGAGRDSAGVIIVGQSAADPTCNGGGS